MNTKTIFFKPGDLFILNRRLTLAEVSTYSEMGYTILQLGGCTSAYDSIDGNTLVVDSSKLWINHGSFIRPLPDIIGSNFEIRLTHYDILLLQGGQAVFGTVSIIDSPEIVIQTAAFCDYGVYATDGAGMGLLRVNAFNTYYLRSHVDDDEVSIKVSSKANLAFESAAEFFNPEDDIALIIGAPPAPGQLKNITDSPFSILQEITNTQATENFIKL